jgi:predicted Zn-dependent protease
MGPANYAMDNLDAQTSYFENYMDVCTSATDVVWKADSSLPARGSYIYLDFVGSLCQRARVTINPTQLSNDINRRKTSCHEIGHSGGLAHADEHGDCMRNGAVSSGHQSYNAHHVEHLNDRS